jgi:uncharacterized membrane protein YraQ (UPF0718 family)
MCRDGSRSLMEQAIVTQPAVFGAVAVVLVLLAAVADHAFGWGTAVAVGLTAHSLWRQRRIESRIERRLAEAAAPGPSEPLPTFWPPEWRRRR